MFAYPNTLQHYIDLFWKCGSTVGAGRGSACSGLNHYLLGVTQLDPIEWNLPFWR
jgi:DNA polymerase-3 subunit alpha